MSEIFIARPFNGGTRTYIVIEYRSGLLHDSTSVVKTTFENLIAENPYVVEKYRREGFEAGAEKGLEPSTLAGTIYIKQLADDYINSLKQ